MRVLVDSANVGNGKTFSAMTDMVSIPGRWIFVSERKISATNIEADLSDLSINRSSKVSVVRINGDSVLRGDCVKTAVEALPEQYPTDRHLIVIITHAALMMCDFSGFAGWRLVIDEVPPFLDFQNKQTHTDVDFCRDNYVLTPLNNGWSSVTLTPEGHSWSVASLEACQSRQHFAKFHQRALEASRSGATRHLLCNVEDWSAMATRGVQWCWASPFSVLQLAAFEEVRALGSNFCDDVGVKITRFFDGKNVDWQMLPPRPTPPQRVPQPRNVEIYYYSHDRASALSWFEEDHGRAVLIEIGRDLRKRLPAGQSIWTANDSGKPGATPRAMLNLPEQDYLTPRQAGTNAHMGVHAAAAIYAAKPCPNMLSFLKCLSLDTSDWTRSTEYEAIFQFVTRTSLREPMSRETVRLWVFDRWQAEHLQCRFADLPHLMVTVEKVDIELPIRAKAKTGPKPKTRTPEENERRKVARREANTAARRAKRAAARALTSHPAQ